MNTTDTTPGTTREPTRDPSTIRSAVREHYAQILDDGASGCCAPSTTETPVEGTGEASCCGAGPQPVSLALGYTSENLSSVPAGADLGIGCGNPHALARIETGMTVLDLGCGAGFDAFLAARTVGETGQVIGVDMTPEMLTKARANAEAGGYTNVEFRLGEIEHLPVADASVDVIISNCVINLSPDKQAVFNEALRVLRPAGRLAVSDVVATAEIPEDVRTDPDLYASCVAGASTVAEVRAMLETAGFTEIEVQPVDQSRTFIQTWVPGRNIADYLISADIQATRRTS
jgi:SAM-dependent methyltransferase